jgi:peptide/nickel transport system substrate-binding protein
VSENDALMTRGRFLKGAAVSVAVPTVLSASVEQAFAATQRKGQRSALRKTSTITVAETTDFDNLDPHLTTGGSFQYDMRFNIFEALFTYTKTANFVPQLATSYTQTNPRTVVVNLRPGVTFHNGTAFNADTVKFTFARLRGKKFAGPWQDAASIVGSVQIINAHKIVLHLTGPTPPDVLLSHLADVAMVEPTSAATLGKKPIGTGPYKFVNWVPGSSASMTRNTSYWRRGLPLTDNIVVKFLPDEDARILNLQSGAVDVIRDITYAGVSRVAKGSGLTAGATRPNITADMVYVNCKSGPTKSPLVRKAISMCFDRSAWIKDFLNGLGTPAGYSLLAPGNWALYAPAAKAQYNLTAAKALIQQAGYKSGFDLEAILPQGNQPDQNAALLYQDALKKIGVNLKITTLDGTTWVNRLIALDYGIAPDSLAYGGLADPSVWWAHDPIAQGLSGYKNPQWDALIKKGLTTLTRSGRRAVYVQLQKIIMRDVPFWAEAYEGLTYGRKKSVQGLEAGYGPLGRFEWAHVVKG